MSRTSIADYFDALERLSKGNTIVVPKGTRINNDSVALEAGRGKGAIKRSRLIFSELIAAINKASEQQLAQESATELQVGKARMRAEKYRSELDAALARELCLIREIFELKKELNSLTGRKVIPLLGHNTRKHTES